LEEYLSDVTAHRFNKEGRLTQVLTMQSWSHLKGENISHLTLPVVKLYQLDGSFWDISAKTGLSFQANLNKKLEKLQLQQDVTVVRWDKNQTSPWELKTQHLVYLPQTRVAITDDPVVVNGSGMEVHAIGMRANLDQQKIDFLKEVKTDYATPQA
jgi:LPS export ABC transporter protein LptC